MKTLLAILVTFPVHSFAGVPIWRQVESGTRESLYAVATADEVTAVAVGAHGTLLRSEDAGETWSTILSVPEWDLRGVAFPDSLHGFAVGYDGEAGLLLRTEDGGLTWWGQELGRVLGGVHFADACHGAVLGGPTGVLHTDDCGTTWQAPKVPPSDSPVSVFFTDADHAFIAAFHFSHPPWGSIFATSDGGATWEERASAPPLYGVAFADAMRGTAVGGVTGIVWFGTVTRTTDGGQTWEHQLSVTDTLFTSVAYAGDLGVVSGDVGVTLWTYDGGETWTQGRGGASRVALFPSGKAVGVGGGGYIVVAP